ncbi:BgTH12-07825 [Blumeria graminis f. sp. triticale]|uniref:BgtE-20044 n=3 Tax=Blumeria graminis TaxID=34373 RepID=A0A381LGS2_BLUGR|nr:BgTH12-07825 [Blumeria graminis f. sp. triticale]VDB96459.1 BgtE-20044 [Blumeria graminis f. sp. tritici]
MKPLSVATMAVLAGFPRLVPAPWFDPLIECPSGSRYFHQDLLATAIDAKPENIEPDHPSIAYGNILGAYRFRKKILDGTLMEYLLQYIDVLPTVRLYEQHGEDWKLCFLSAREG